MALYDHRVFRVGEDWWVAQVHSASGAGWSEHPSLTDETVTFTCVSDEEEPSRVATISAGGLMRATYRQVRALLERTKSIEHRFEMAPVNPPWPDESPPARLYTDEEGLRWSVKQRRMVQQSQEGRQLRDVVEIVCLDDSTLHMITGLGDPFDVDEDLVRLVKSGFDDTPLTDPYDPDR